MTDDDARPDELVYAPPKAEAPALVTESLRPKPPAVFFAVSPLKLIVMSTVTFGMYQFFWFYVNWRRVLRREGGRIWPFWRAVFAYFFCYSLFSKIKKTAIVAGVESNLNCGGLAGGWIFVIWLLRLPAPWALLGLTSVLFLVPVQRTIHEVNTVMAPGHDPNTRFSVWNVLGILLGGLLLVFSAIDAWMGQPE